MCWCFGGGSSRKSHADALSASMHGREYDSMSLGASAAQLSMQVTSNNSIHSRPISKGATNQPNGRSAAGSRLIQSSIQGDIISQTAQKYMAQFAHSLPARSEDVGHSAAGGRLGTISRAGSSFVDGPKSLGLLSIRGSASLRENPVQSVDALALPPSSSYRVSPVLRQAIDDFGSRRQSESMTRSQPSYSGHPNNNGPNKTPPIQDRKVSINLKSGFHPGNSSAGGCPDVTSQSNSQVLSQDLIGNKKGTGRRQTINFLPNGDVEVTGLPLAAMKRLGNSLNTRPTSNSSSQQAQVSMVAPNSHTSTGGGADDRSDYQASGSTLPCSGGVASHVTGSVASSGGAALAMADTAHFAASVTSQGTEASPSSTTKRLPHPNIPSILANRTESGDLIRASSSRGLRRVHLSLPGKREPEPQDSSSPGSEGAREGLVKERSKLSIPRGTSSTAVSEGDSSIHGMTRLNGDDDLSSRSAKRLLTAGHSPLRGRTTAGSFSGHIEEQARPAAAVRPFPSTPLGPVGLDAFTEGDDGVGLDEDSDEDTPADTLRGHYEGPMSLLGGPQPDPYQGQAGSSSTGLRRESRSLMGKSVSSAQQRRQSNAN